MFFCYFTSEEGELSSPSWVESIESEDMRERERERERESSFTLQKRDLSTWSKKIEKAKDSTYFDMVSWLRMQR